MNQEVQLSRDAATTAQMLNAETRYKFANAVSPALKLSDVSEPYRGWIKDNTTIPADVRSIAHRLDRVAKAAEPDVVKVRRNAIERGLDRLADIPDDPKKPGHILVPWKHKQKRPKVDHDAWGDSELRSYKIADLIATQDYVRRETVEWHLTNLNDNGSDNKALPNVVIDDGNALIYDGHHRLVAYWLLGADWSNCWTLEV